MMRLLTQAQKTYTKYDNYVDWIKDATVTAEAEMVKHNVKRWSTTQCKRKWSWAGKVAQLQGDRWTSTAASWEPAQIRPRGRPKHRWHDSINNFLTSHSGILHSDDDWMKVAKDPITWNALQREYILFADLQQ